ncbi:MAG: hypothetical protein QOI88_435 [Gammaproteobacteria bacterium]|jgi:hypothetical protein|nr:hypothetical protein [Gammaproteobacteria bacterium]
MRIAAQLRAWLLLGACLAANVLFQRLNPPTWSDAYVLGNPPPTAAVRAATLGEPVFAGYLVMLYVQNLNVHLGLATPLAAIDRPVILRWLDLVTDLDPGSGYPLLLATGHFAETGSPEQRRLMLDWVYRRFEERPNQRWEWLVHAVYVARHVLNDNALAEYYAAALRTRVTDPKAPSWVRQMDLLLHADLGEAADARAILGGLVAAGQIRSPAELKFLESRLPPLKGNP